MEVWFLLAAFVFGFAASQFGLPPLVGYLAAGYALSALGFESSGVIEAVADVGVLLMLFGIGLKLRIRTMTRPHVWGTALVFVVVGSVIPAAGLLIVTQAGTPLDVEAALTVGLVLSFSSTVFAVKALERTGETGSIGGRIAIGILIFQDLVAVAYLALNGATAPSLWALLVIPGLVVAKPLFTWFLDRTGHGEVLILLAFTLAVGVGAAAFEAVGLKSDLGALAAGAVLANHPRSSEIADRILGIKDLLLVGFFLSIGLVGVPTLGQTLIGVAAILLIPTRSYALFWLLSRFRLRTRTALHASITLSAYSEFGLLVVVTAVGTGVLAADWIPTIGVAVAGSFIVASIGNSLRYRIYDRLFPVLARFEREPILEEDAVLDFGDARVLIFGMGRVGTGAYDELRKRGHDRVVGIERKPELVASHVATNRVVVRGDAVDRDFWERARLHPDVELVVAAMSSHEANLECVRRIREFLPRAAIASVAGFRDQVADLHEAGVDVARNLYEEAGQALADDAAALLERG